MRTVRERDPSMWNSNGHVARAFLHSSITYIFEYVSLYRTQRWFSTIYYNSSHAESRWGKDATKRTGDDDA